MKILVTGGTGFIGSALISALTAAQHEVLLITRPGVDAPSTAPGVLWDGHTLHASPRQWQGISAVINLAGEPIAGARWSSAQKFRILDSRIRITRALVEQMRHWKPLPRVLLSASAVGYYGSDTLPQSETAAPGSDFLSEVCRQWESAAQAAQAIGVRVVTTRFGLVLGPGGGLLRTLVGLVRSGLAAIPGPGRQWVSWVHRLDLVRALIFLLDHAELQGPVNLTAPEPVPMAVLMHSLGHVLHRPIWPPVPAWVIRLMLGGQATLVLSSQRVLPTKLLEAGFSFQFPHLTEAVKNIFSK